MQGGSVIKPFVGSANDGPSDAAVICPIEFMHSGEGVVIGHGICPRYSDEDAYVMAANAIDEAVRNCVSVGADPCRIAILDNFCWPDPIYDAVKTPDGKEKLAQLVRANKALYDYSKAFMVPIISGKDSMKNDYKIGNIKISVPPTLLITSIGKMDDVRQAISMDFKQAGDLIYVLGVTKSEMGRSEYAAMKKIAGGSAPTVDAEAAKILYQALHLCIKEGLVASCHDCSEGGLAVALAEASFAGGLGVEASLQGVPREGCLSDVELLFSESASRFVVSVSTVHAHAFEKCFSNSFIGKVGSVVDDLHLQIKGVSGATIINAPIFSLKESWQNPLKGKC